MFRLLYIAFLFVFPAFAQNGPSFAERLGWKKTDRVLIPHMDDAGMSFDSNSGIERVLEHGAARSLGVMMPCPWVPQIVAYIKAHPGTDAGLHPTFRARHEITVSKRWRDYRWSPLAGVSAVPGLIDPQGAFRSSVKDVVGHASPEEVDREIRAQLARAERMGFHPTQLDSHMGTLFESEAFLAKYVQLGVEKHIPVILPGGQDTFLQSDTPSDSPGDPRWTAMRKLGETLWNSGLPVLDDLHNASYGWHMPASLPPDDRSLQRWRAARYIESPRTLKPGLTMVVMHCTDPTAVFSHIANSGEVRRGDMLAMRDPAFHPFLKNEGFLVTTWEEALARRRRAK